MTTASNYPPGFDDSILDGYTCPACDGTGKNTTCCTSVREVMSKIVDGVCAGCGEEVGDCNLCDGTGEVPRHVAKNYRLQIKSEGDL